MMNRIFPNCALLLLTMVGSSLAQEQIASIQDFKAGLDNGDYDLVLDVRTDEERAGGHIPGSIHVPIADFDSDNLLLKSLEGTSCQKECATIVATCSVGGRAATAIRRLQDLGFQGTLINGLGTSQWTGAGFELTTEETQEPVCVSTDICPDAMGSDSMMDGDTMMDEDKMDGDSMMDGDMMDGDSMMDGDKMDAGEDTMDSSHSMDGDTMDKENINQALEGSSAASNLSARIVGAGFVMTISSYYVALF